VTGRLLRLTALAALILGPALILAPLTARAITPVVAADRAHHGGPAVLGLLVALLLAYPLGSLVTSKRGAR
jgi:hypothetical protein